LLNVALDLLKRKGRGKLNRFGRSVKHIPSLSVVTGPLSE
jgi:hypothetical protein